MSKFKIQKVSEGSYFVPQLPLDDRYKQCASYIESAKNICILTGAGISTNIGIPDFRSKAGWYSKEPENILSFSNFMKNPKEVYGFLYRYYKLTDVEPSTSHKLIAKLEHLDKNISVITQNIERLHQKSGSTNVIEFHGSLHEASCIMCGKEYSSETVLNDNIYNLDFNYKCSCGGYIKPNITLFEEDIDELTFAKDEVGKADLVIIIGTSMQVEPFASLPFYAPLQTPFIIINKEATCLDDNNMSVVINEDCDETLEKIIASSDILSILK